MARRQYGTGSVYQRASDGRWVGAIQAGWTANGTRRIITVSAKTKPAVLRKLRDKQRQIGAEGTPEAGTATATVKSWCVLWLKTHQRSVRPKTYTTDAGAVNRWVIPTIGHRRLQSLTPGDVRAVTDAIRKAGRSSTTGKHAHGVLLRILRAAIAEGHPVPQRVLLVKSPTRAVSDRDAIPLPDALELLQAAASLPDGSRWVAALLQGMRQGECLGLTWDAIDFTAGTIDVSWQLQSLPYADRAAGTFAVPDGYEARQLHRSAHLVRPKTAKGHRLIPLVPWMAAALTEWQRVAPVNPWALVWTGVDERNGRHAVVPRSGPADRRAWWDMQDVAQVASTDGTTGRRYALHEARHTTATLLLEAGVDTEVIKAIMGHSSIATTRGYQHVSQALARKALEDVAAKLGLIHPNSAKTPPAVAAPV